MGRKYFFLQNAMFRSCDGYAGLKSHSVRSTVHHVCATYFTNRSFKSWYYIENISLYHHHMTVTYHAMYAVSQEIFWSFAKLWNSVNVWRQTHVILKWNGSYIWSVGWTHVHFSWIICTLGCEVYTDFNFNRGPSNSTWSF